MTTISRGVHVLCDGSDWVVRQDGEDGGFGTIGHVGSVSCGAAAPLGWRRGALTKVMGPARERCKQCSTPHRSGG